MAQKDFYAILGVGKKSSQEELKKAFRKRARSLHPDLNPDDPKAEMRFKELQGAYDILSDPQKRAAYDRFGPSAFVRGGGGPNASGPSPDDVINGFIQKLWKKPTGRRPGEDLRYHLNVTLSEVFSGGAHTISVNRQMRCDTCQATGSATPEGKQRCGNCEGLGEVSAMVGPLNIKRPCSKCRGTGFEIIDPCPTCEGKGRKTVPESITVKIPKGVETGQRLKLKGKGNGGYRRGDPGSLYVVIHVKPHATFKRQGKNLLCTLRIPEELADTGGDVSIETLDGQAEISLPPGTREGQMFRLTGLGLPGLKGTHRGDQHVQILVGPSPGPRSFLQSLAQVAGQGSGGLFSRVRGRIQGEA